MSEGSEEKNNQDQNQVQQPQEQQQIQQLQQQQQAQPQTLYQPQQQQQQNQGAPMPSQAERMAFVKFARYTALVADRLAGAMLQMTAKLEDEGILKCGRSSRLERDKKLRLYAMKIHKSDSDISDMMKLIPDHPDAEKLISSLFKGVRNIVASAENLNLNKLPDTNPLIENIQVPLNNDDNGNNNNNDNDQQHEINDIINNDHQETEIQTQNTSELTNNESLETVENPISDLANSNPKE